MEELHYPPGAEPAKAPEPKAPAETDPKPAEPAPEPKAEPKGDEPKPEDPKPEEPKPDEPPAPTLKKRSIYDDLKDTRKDLKEANARIKELESQPADKPADAPAPKAEKPPAPADDLEAFAQENDLDAKSLGRLAEIIAKRIPQAQLSEEDKQGLADLKQFRAERARDAEDREILSQSTSVKTQLDVHDDAELQKVMAEIVKLAHTPEFHDKEVDYILWKNKDALSKLVSPKKPSFESGGGKAEAAADEKVDFSKGGVTPAQAASALAPGKSSYEVSTPK